MDLESIKFPGNTCNLSWLEILDISHRKSKTSFPKHNSNKNTHRIPLPQIFHWKTEECKNFAWSFQFTSQQKNQIFCQFFSI